MEDPIWGPPAPILEFSTEDQFENVRKLIRDVILKTFRLHAYNTVNSFVDFRKAFREKSNGASLEDFNTTYPVTFRDHSLSCVGLSLKLMTYLSEADPSLKGKTFLVCGDEYPLQKVDPKHKSPPTPEEAVLKGHVLVALEISLVGRKGYVMIDVGLALDIPVVVMRDGLPPHTGPFNQIARVGYREYCMDMTDSNSDYVLWKIQESRDDLNSINRKRFLYVGRPFLNPEILERRNRVYQYHAYMLMGSGGVRAALYFVLGKDDRQFTVFVPSENGNMRSVQLPYEFFSSSSIEESNSLLLSAGQQIETVDQVLQTFSKMCEFGGKDDLKTRFGTLSQTCSDEIFLDHVVALNKEHICKLYSAMP